MYRIAICDDEAAELDKTEELLRIYQKRHQEYEFETERFHGAEEFICAVEEGYAPDLLVMDIYMPGKTGIEAAKELRLMRSECRIIFLTTSTEYALEAFRVEAEQYLIKPVMPEEFFAILDKQIKEIENQEAQYVLFKAEGRIRRVSVRRIVYCEAQKKHQCVFLEDGTQIMQNLTMSRLCEMLCVFSEFAKVGVAYIVNMEHIESLSAQEIQLDNGRNIYLPRGTYQTLKERYFDFYCSNV